MRQMLGFQPIVALALILLVAGCSADHGDAQSKLDDWNILLATELPAGTPREAVEAFFLAHGLESSDLPSDHKLVAIERDVASHGLVTTSISFNCLLDQGERLKSCKASLAFTGP
jgi:hypothetical protein